MHAPYTDTPLDAVLVAQTSVAAAITAFVAARPMRPRAASLVFLAGVWLAALVPFEAQLLADFGAKIAPTHAATALRVAAALVTASFVVATPRWIAIAAAALEAALYWTTANVPESDAELGIVHVAAFAALFGAYDQLVRRAQAPGAARPLAPSRSYARHDVALFAATTLVSGIVATFVLERFANSGDEWAYTYQADLFAHGKLYATPPPCPTAFENYWVFFYMGRAFAQYTPGWSLAMAPFRLVRLEWLAASFALGAAAVGTAHVARRVARAVDGASERMIASAGTFAGIAAALGASQLLNGASRYPHTFVCACFAWSIESVCRLAQDAPSRRAQWGWGALLGLCASMMLATRPSDGATLGIGLFLYFVVMLARRRIGWRGLLGTAATFALVAAVSLVIMRAQLGEWLKTGYSISEQYHPWIVFRFSAPKLSELKMAAPLGMQAYCFWPASLALGLLGLAMARRARGIAAMLVIGCAALVTLYAFIEYGRHEAIGYGTRYTIPMLVLTASGTGVVFAVLWDAAARRSSARPAFAAAAPFVAATAIALVGMLRVGQMMYPAAFKEVHQRDAPLRAIADAKLKNAVVFVRGGEVGFDPLDLTQNFATGNPDVLVANDRGLGEVACVKKHFEGRKLYRAQGRFFDATITPLD